MADSILLTSLPASGFEDLSTYRESGGYQGLEKSLSLQPGEVVEQIDASGLRGRGGASFPAARKWRIALEAQADEKYVIANGGEHEPGSDKDKYLVEHHPHRVLEGLLLCGHATGASIGYLYLIEDMAGPLAAAEKAVQELRDAGLLGESILGTSFRFDVRIHRAPTTYVAGEETAAIDSIEGGPGKPKEKPPYPGEAGLFGKPTTVNNVETLAHAAWILRHGAEAFRAIGTKDSTGTMLFTLGEEVNRPGVYERPFGSTYRELIEECGGGTRDGRAVRAVLPALSCTFLGPEHLDTPIGYESLKAAGSSPGCGGVHLFLDGDDVVERVAGIAKFFMDEQCGQCPPCRMATSQYAHVLNAVLGGKKGDFVGTLNKISGLMRGKGRCSLIDMASAPVVSAASLFTADFEAKASDGEGA